MSFPVYQLTPEQSAELARQASALSAARVDTSTAAILEVIASLAAITVCCGTGDEPRRATDLIIALMNERDAANKDHTA